MANTKLTTPDIIDLTSVNNTDGVVIPKGPTGSVVTHYLVVGGGGAGNYGGGGAGGYLTSYPSGTALSLELATDYTVTVGAGGTTGASGNNAGNSGGQSIFDTIIADGGGGGGGAGGSSATDLAKNGGSGGGGGYLPTGAGSATGVGIGNAGGTGSTGSGGDYGGGGGGAGAAGNDASVDGDGGDGLQNNITGTNLYYAGGGGAAKNGTPIPQGGQGGGGTGTNATVSMFGTQGTDGLGGGGGGRTVGGTGVVIIRVPTGITATFSGGVTANGSTGGTIAPNTSTGDNVWIITATTDASQTVTFGGTIADGRPNSPVNGEFRYNTTTKLVEFYDGANWYSLSSNTIIPQPGTTGVCNYPTAASALYQLNGNADDTCGNFNGTANSNVAWVAGKFGNCAEFSTTSTYNGSIITVGNVVGVNNFSVSLWYYQYALTSVNQYLYYFTYYGNYISSGGTVNYNDSIAGNLSYSIPSSIRLNNWNHVVFVKSSTTGMFIYFNGAEVATNASGTSDVQSSYAGYSKSLIGGAIYNAGSNYRFFNGKIDQLRAFNTPLTALQVGYLYTETAP